MPDAMADELLQRQQAEFAALRANGGGEEDEDEDIYDMDEADFEIERDYWYQCKEWLESELDDARLLSTGLVGVHAALMPLTFRLAQLLAPPGAILELRVAPRPTGDELSRLERMRDVHGHVDASMTQHSWTDAAVVDISHQVVYTLAPSYFKRGCPPAAVLIEDKELVRRWCKDGGIPRHAYAWLRFRRDLPLDVVRLVQARLEGTDTMDIPRWLDYADATATNWREAREWPHLETALLCLQSAPVLPLVRCRRVCHPAHGHTAACDALHAIEQRLQALAVTDGHARTIEAKRQRALLVLDMMWRDQQADGVRDPALEEELDREREAMAARVPESDRLKL